MVAHARARDHGGERKQPMSEENTQPDSDADSAAPAGPPAPAPTADGDPQADGVTTASAGDEPASPEAASSATGRGGSLRAVAGLLTAPFRLLPFRIQRRSRRTAAPGDEADVIIEPPPGGPAARAAAADPPSPPRAPRDDSDPDAEDAGAVAMAGGEAPGLLANPRVQLVLAALAGAVIAVGGGIAGGFLERVEDGALVDEAGAEAVLDADDAHAQAEPDHGIPSAPGPNHDDDDTAHDTAEDADAHLAESEADTGADPAADPTTAEAPKSRDYLSGYFDGQACALLDPDSGECLGARDIVARLNGAYLEGWSAALRSLGVDPGGAQPASAAEAPPRIVDLTRIEVEDLDE